MGQNFLGALADQINNQFSLGENTDHGLDAVVDGQHLKYGALGDFAHKFDQSAERRYVEEGYLRRDPYNTDPKQFEVLMQEPSATILIKKRMFSSVNENFRPDFMDKDEKLYYKAMKILFQNKCRQISVLEKLSKIQKITSGVGSVSEQLMPIIISLTDDLGSGFNTGPSLAHVFGGTNSSGQIGSFTKVIDRIRRLYAFNTSSKLTSWITDPTNLWQSSLGQGTGVIEITNFTNLTTTTTLNLSTPGSFSFNVMDPYEATVITEYDIERALSDATNSHYNHKLTQFGKQGADQVINDTTVRLNQLRSLRRASPISFKVNPDTLLGRRVIAIIDRVGTDLVFEYVASFDGGRVNVGPDYLVGGAIAGFDGLDTIPKNNLGPDSNILAENAESELSVFKRLVSAIFSKLTLDANTRGAFVLNNQLVNYARRKLRFTFVGQPIIQPMDTVHIYVNTKSRYDNKLLSGLNNMFTGSGILQNLNHTITDVKNSFDTLFNPAGSVDLQAEKSAFVGPDFPNFLWSLMRTQFVTEKEGTHIFGGIVQGVQDDWGDGKFTLNVKGADNTAYFDMGKINFKPSADVFDGAFFDPLTPFKSKFDTITSAAKSDSPELLDENKLLLGQVTDPDAPLVKYKLGPNAGEAVREDNFNQDIAIEKATRSLSKVYYAPDGLVYKWKEGIGVLTQFGSSMEINDPNKVGNFSLTKNPFAGQDIMNVLSLLIVGQPYNFATYWRAVSNLDGSQRDLLNQQDAAHSFYDSLRKDLQKNNTTWGNFIPFKNLSMDEKSVSAAMNTQFRVMTRNKDIDSKLQELAEYKRLVTVLNSGSALHLNLPNKIDPIKAEAKVAALQAEVTELIKAVQEDDKKSNALIVSGNDTSLDTSEFVGKGNDPASRRLLRRKINHLTRRMSYNVKANDDKNLFIVDDSYDKDYDILAYEQSFSDGQKTFKSEYETVRQKIITTADLLNLEVFCDTQGHIRVRSPQYNRMPSSVFYRMMYLKKTSGVQIFPQFLDDLFGDQIKTLTEKVEIIEDQIRLDCAVIGIGKEGDSSQTLDWKYIAFITNYGANEGSGESFNFISTPDGTISNLGFVKDSANPDRKLIDQDSDSFLKVNKQATSTKSTFTNNDKFKVILEALTDNGLELAGYGLKDIPQFSANTKVDELINRIQTKSGQQVSKNSFVNTNSVPIIDIFKVTKELSEKIGERQRSVKLLYSALKNAVEANSLDDDSSKGSRLLTPGVYGNSHVPEIFEHMIEDESYDDYGPGSGSRYIIKRAQIKSMSTTVNPPDFTMVEVRGLIDPSAPNSTLHPELNVFSQGGNSQVTAAAIDYDTCRNYGYRDMHVIEAPFLKDPNTQCAPYASMILSRARKNILRGTVTIALNEYMQPGEVVFIQDRGMLFYVSSVTHNFTYGSFSTTTLNLTYGHTPGEYIPTTLDVIGKILYNNRDLSNSIIQRQSSSYNDSSVGTVIKGKNAIVIDTGDKNDDTNSNSATNANTISNMLYTTFQKVNDNNTHGNNVKASVELRIYYDKSTKKVNDDLRKFAVRVQEILTTPGQLPKQAFNKSSSSSQNHTFKIEDVNIVEVNMSDIDDGRSPSQKAIDAARNNAANVSTNILDQFIENTKNVANSISNKSPNNTNIKEREKIRTALFTYVVDCWVKIEPVIAPTDIVSTSIATRQ